MCKVASIPQPAETQAPLRAIVEIIDGELLIFPIADCDGGEKHILQTLRFAVREES